MNKDRFHLLKVIIKDKQQNRLTLSARQNQGSTNKHNQKNLHFSIFTETLTKQQ